jgi:hypothetical protein
VVHLDELQCEFLRWNWNLLRPNDQWALLRKSSHLRWPSIHVAPRSCSADVDLGTVFANVVTMLIRLGLLLLLMDPDVVDVVARTHAATPAAAVDDRCTAVVNEVDGRYTAPLD